MEPQRWSLSVSLASISHCPRFSLLGTLFQMKLSLSPLPSGGTTLHSIKQEPVAMPMKPTSLILNPGVDDNTYNAATPTTPTTPPPFVIGTVGASFVSSSVNHNVKVKSEGISFVSYTTIPATLITLADTSCNNADLFCTCECFECEINSRTTIVNIFRQCYLFNAHNCIFIYIYIYIYI